MKFIMISALAAALTIASATPTPAAQVAGKPLFPSGSISLTVTTAGTELAGYLPNVFVGYTGEVLISKNKPAGFNQPVLTGWRGVSFDNVEFGEYEYLTLHIKDSKPATFESKEGCPAPDIGNFFFDRNYDDKLYYFPDWNTPLNLWKACLDNSSGDYIVYWDSKNSISINDPKKKCIKIDIHVTDLSVKV